MVDIAETAELFPLIEPGHVFHPQIRQMAEAIAARPPAGAGPATVHAEVKALRGADGAWVLDRFYWSRQTWAGPGRAGFRAETLSYRHGAREAEWHDFPADPYLPAIAGYFRGPGAGAEVLRYVPLRRLTFRIPVGGATVVGKFKRASRFCAAHERLKLVAEAVGRRQPGFRVARPLAIDAERRLVTQEALPGENLAEQIAPGNAVGLLERLGRICRALHELPVPGAPGWDEQAFRAEVGAHMEWIAFMRPELEPLLGRAGAALARRAPRLGTGERAFCHGDLVPSQVLAGPGEWALVDFDLCRLGDPHHELAMLLAALPHDVPAIGALTAAGRAARVAACEQALLNGYQSQAERSLDLGRLAWYRVCAEIYYLALGLKKGWLDQTGLMLAAGRLADQIEGVEAGV